MNEIDPQQLLTIVGVGQTAIQAARLELVMGAFAFGHGSSDLPADEVGSLVQSWAKLAAACEARISELEGDLRREAADAMLAARAARQKRHSLVHAAVLTTITGEADRAPFGWSFDPKKPKPEPFDPSEVYLLIKELAELQDRFLSLTNATADTV